MTNETSLNLHQRLIEVRKSVAYLQKENAGHQYKYVSSSQVLSSLRAAMDTFRVLLTVEVVEAKISEFTSREEKAKQWLTELWVQYCWINADDPADRFPCRFYGQGIDTAEKGVGKALTYTEKYFLLKTFNIATDKDDPDAFQEKGEPQKSRAPTGTKQKKQPATPEAMLKYGREFWPECTMTHLEAVASDDATKPVPAKQWKDKEVERIKTALRLLKEGKPPAIAFATAQSTGANQKESKK